MKRGDNKKKRMGQLAGGAEVLLFDSVGKREAAFFIGTAPPRACILLSYLLQHLAVLCLCLCVCVCVLCFHWWGMLQIKERNNKPVSPFTYSPIVITIMPYLIQTRVHILEIHKTPSHCFSRRDFFLQGHRDVSYGSFTL